MASVQVLSSGGNPALGASVTSTAHGQRHGPPMPNLRQGLLGRCRLQVQRDRRIVYGVTPAAIIRLSGFGHRSRGAPASGSSHSLQSPHLLYFGFIFPQQTPGLCHWCSPPFWLGDSSSSSFASIRTAPSVHRLRLSRIISFGERWGSTPSIPFAPCARALPNLCRPAFGPRRRPFPQYFHVRAPAPPCLPCFIRGLLFATGGLLLRIFVICSKLLHLHWRIGSSYVSFSAHICARRSAPSIHLVNICSLPL